MSSKFITISVFPFLSSLFTNIYLPTLHLPKRADENGDLKKSMKVCFFKYLTLPSCTYIHILWCLIANFSKIKIMYFLENLSSTKSYLVSSSSNFFQGQSGNSHKVNFLGEEGVVFHLPQVSVNLFKDPQKGA